MPTFSATPTIAKALMAQSRSARSSGVPTKQDIVILSKMTSLAWGSSSGTSWNGGESRRNAGFTWSSRVTRLPRHRGPQLKHASRLAGQRHVPTGGSESSRGLPLGSRLNERFSGEGIRCGPLTPCEPDERNRERLGRGATGVRRGIAPDVGGAAENRLCHDAAARAHQ